MKKVVHGQCPTTNTLNMKSKKIKILAPVGNFEALQGAIQAKADEIYFGIEKLNMRAAGANNFSLNDLKKISEKCKESKIKSWVTLNTVVYDKEFEEVEKILDEIKKNEIDGIIASDLGIIELAFNKKIEICASTQMSISNLRAIKVLSKWVDRVVLARELTLRQVVNVIKEIKKENIKGPKGKLIEVEVFGHGAMCVGLSGRCQMSLYHHNLSANRGECIQICRRKYEVKEMKTGKKLVLDNNLIMSRSDLCTLGLLDKLVASGIGAIKIEGRARSGEYVERTVSVYKKGLDLIESGKYNKEAKEKLLKEVKMVFNRGFSEGYYMGRSINEWAKADNNQASEKKKLLGIIDHYYRKIKVAQIKLAKDDQVKDGNDYLILSPKNGVIRGKFENIRMDGKIMTFKVDKKVSKNDRLFILEKK